MRAAAAAVLMLLLLCLGTEASYTGPFFVKEPPSRVDFANETGTTIDCSASGTPPPAVSWVSGDGKPVMGIPQLVEVLTNGSLLFYPFHPSNYRHDVHAATYRCSAANSVGRILSRDIRVKAVVLQYYELSVQYTKSVIRGNTALLKCSIPSFVKDYITVTSWLQDSSFNIYPSIKGDGKYHMLPTGELLIQRVDEADKYRSYQCRAMNRLTATPLLSVGRARFSVTDHPTMSAPRALDKTVTISVKKDHSVVMPCYAEGNPPPSFRWYRQEGQLRRQVVEDDRMFRVEVKSLGLFADSHHLFLQVVPSGRSTATSGGRGRQDVPGRSKVSRVSWQILITCCCRWYRQEGQQRRQVVEDDRMFRVEVKSLRWYRQEGQLRRQVVEDDRMFRVGECLVLLHADEADGGTWVCVANNSVGMEHIDITLKVLSPLTVTLQPSGQFTADIGSSVNLTCQATSGSGASGLQRVWLKDGHVVGHIYSSQNPVLPIPRVQRDDAGMYQCLVRAEADSAQASVQLVLGSAHPTLVYKFIQQTLQPGPPVSLKCIASGNPTPHITWKLDGLPLPSNTDRFLIGQYVTLHGEVISHVNISNVQVEDGGIYQCTATNRIGEISHSADMRVYGPPYVRPMPNISAVAGEPLLIACPVAGYPIDSITWEKEGRRLPLNRRQRVFPNGTLLLDNVQRDPDSGEYRCTAENKQGRTSSQQLHLSVIVPPRITPFSFLTDLHVGDRVGVQCFITKGDLPLDIQWRKDGGALDQDVSVQQYGQYTSSLSIESLAPRHAGSYTCVATNQAATDTHSSNLLVNVPPRWVTEPRDRNVTRESFVTFDCQAEGFPAPTLIWRKVIGGRDYQDLSLSRARGLQVFPNGTFIIRQASPEHQGQYLCEATNGIGAGLSATVSLVVLNPPEFEVKSAQASVRRGASQTLECQAQGDQPMSITWHREGQPPVQFNPRYVIKENKVKGGFLSALYISSSVKSDSGTFVCVATNPYGRADRIVHLQVQDAPGRPKNLRVVDATSRSLSVSWAAPSDERSPVLQYLVQYRQESGVTDEWQKIGVNTDLSCTIRDLTPATEYAIRVLAENELGAGEPSEPIVVQTEGEAPAGEPQNVVVTATASDTLRVAWTAPLHHLWNGEILGYYVGYREHGVGRLSGYNFTTVAPRASGSGLAVIKGLKKFRKYGVVIQAFNEKGPGPMAAEIVTQTLEDVPSAPPVEIQCEAQSSQSILVRWHPPPQPYQNGQIQGYKVSYENMEEWPPGHIEAETKVTTDQSTELYGLQKYSNYSIVLWAFTQVGDGVKSRPVFCMTDEDVPEAPAGIKVMVGSPTSLIVSWAKPLRTNGKLTFFTMYSRVLEGGRERDSTKKKLPPSQMHYQTSELRKGEAYEFWVTAFTKVGEGQSTQVVYSTISNRVPAAIISWGERVTARRRSKVMLPCLAVGQPSPKHSWTGPDGSPPHSDGFTITKDGSLEISEIQRQHQGNYTCFVTNANGSDQIVYNLHVLVPPSAPVVGITSTGASWLYLQWSIVDTGGSAVRGFIINYRQQEPGEWEERPVPRDSTSYRLTGLVCGTEYHVQVMAFNSVGSGAPSPIVVARTDGNKPGQPSHAEFLDPNSTSITLHMKAWHDNGCPIISFSVEYREGTHHEWITVGNDVQVRDSFLVVGLWPGQQYVIKVRATNSAGTTIAEYRATTLTITGVTLGPDSVKGYPDDSPGYMEAGILVPLSVCIMAVLFLIAAITVCIRRKNEREMGLRNQTEAQAMVALDNKQNLAQREQYYAAVHKGMTTPVRDLHCIEQIPEYPDDISPYATFHVAGTERPSSPTNIQSFVYHDHRLAAMETMQLKSTNFCRDDYTKLRGSSKGGGKCISTGSDYSGSTTDQWSEHNLAVSRNDRIPLQSMLYNGGGPESSTSPEASPVPDRRPSQFRAHVRREEGGNLPFSTRLDPPTGFSDPHELSEAECDMESFHGLKCHKSHKKSPKTPQHRHPNLHRVPREKKPHHFTIAV
ncbi:cell adhesion molecule Dscam2-like [Macrosteles quadrilineatus]|uniref:cell adhesion molecule Dscam2-like n=1 Tax=Macrosteles quadrilineatus TaxID=74068 RepID=UPI0023E161B1|nr:cell adhesion molecule Dscam2-like [Macrosteles quadrilineatus]